MAWQATTFALVARLIGVPSAWRAPLGLAALAQQLWSPQVRVVLPALLHLL